MRLGPIHYFGLGAAAATFLAVVISSSGGDKKEEEDVPNIIYKGKMQNSHVTYTHNGELERLIDRADGVTWDIENADGDDCPERATRTEGSNPPARYGAGIGPEPPEQAGKLFRHRVDAIEAERNAELLRRYEPPAPEPDPATTPAPAPAPTTPGPAPAPTTPGPAPAPTTPGPAPAPTTPGPAPDPATPAAPDATSAIYAGANYRA